MLGTENITLRELAAAVLRDQISITPARLQQVFKIILLINKMHTSGVRLLAPESKGTSGSFVFLESNLEVTHVTRLSNHHTQIKAHSEHDCPKSSKIPIPLLPYLEL